MDTIGKVSCVRNEHEFEWRIEDFSTLSAEDNKLYESPLFYFANETWCLRICPNGMKENESSGYIGVYLVRKSSGTPFKIDFSLKLKTLGEKIGRQYTSTFETIDSRWGWPKLLKRSTFLENKTELGWSGDSVICTMKKLKSIDEASKTAMCSYCKQSSEAETISFHEEKCLYKPIKCPDCCDVIHLRDWYDHQCQKSRSEACNKLCQDLQAMVFSGDHSDTIIKVKEEEFQLHRNILAARNSYFNSMFKNDMKEKKTGTVTIEDCEPDIFRIFVHFLYTGKVEKLSLENVCELYEVADKYQEDQLRNECLHFMMKRMSEDTFCDFIILALKYDEKKLFENAVESFLTKPNAIIRSVKWQNFAREYPTQANELFIKTVDRYVK